jgi:hypothetical protein
MAKSWERLRQLILHLRQPGLILYEIRPRLTAMGHI